MKTRSRLIAALLLAAPLASRAAEEPQKLTLETSGWLVLNSFANGGSFETMDLPRIAVSRPEEGERALGMAVRQSRLRLNIGIPSDGLLMNAKLKGFVEGDFMGGRGGDVSTVLPRLRHAWVSATWPRLGNLSLLVGQTWGIAPGPYFASSLSHLAVPRFGGAGFLYRRAPQVRVSGDLPVSDFGFIYQAAVLTPGDGSGDRAGFANGEARIAAAYRPDRKPLAEVGLFTHYGREKFHFDPTTGPQALPAEEKTVSSRAFGLDAKLDLPYVQVLGGAWQGQNLDTLASVAGLEARGTQATGFIPGVVLDTPAHTVKSIETRGAWAQAVVTPLKGFQLLVGGGLEDPDDATLPAATAEGRITKNRQLSVGTIVNLTSKWRLSLEGTRYLTNVARPAASGGNGMYTSNQIEVSTLLAL
jgi:hypothetical protein